MTAAELINEYGDLDTLLARAGEIKQPKRRESLVGNAEAARMSKILVTLKDDVPLQTPLEELGVSDPDPGPLLAFLEEMEFRTLFKRVTETLGGTPTVAPPGNGGARPTSSASSAGGPALGLARAAEKSAPSPRPGVTAATNGAPAESSEPLPPENPPFNLDAYETVTDAARLAKWIADARAQGYVAVDTETDGLNPVSAKLVGISMALAPGKACYIPLCHGAKADLLSGERPRQIELATAIELLKPLD
jgi:DNA polymerase-1